LRGYIENNSHLLGVAGYSGEFLPLRSLSDLGVRSEASEKSSPLFRHFEAHSGDYVTKNGGMMGRFPAAAVEST
jgi:hypothetical protein